MGKRGGRRHRIRRGAVVAFALGALSACSVGGHAQPDLSAYAVDAGAFPAGAQVTQVTGAAAAAILADVVGAGRGERVRPADCAPEQLTGESTVSTALLPEDSASPGTLTVVTTRVDTALQRVGDRIGRCPKFVRTNAAGAASTVRQVMLTPPATVAAGVQTAGVASIAITGGAGPDATGASALGVASKTFVAQRDGIRIYAVYRGQATAAAAMADPREVGRADTPALQTLFEKACRTAFAA